MERECKAQPRIFNMNREQAINDYYESPEEDLFDDMPKQLSGMMKAPTHNRGGKMLDDSSLLERNRASMRKFESLTVNGMSLAGLSIGGFSVDLDKVAEKARDVLPIPASKLPIIFCDDNLNFYHHFFQGINMMIGEENVEEISRFDHHFQSGDTEIIDLIADMLKAGYERHDSEITTFMKKVLLSTYELGDDRRRRDEDPFLIVSTNVYGLQYIEPGMKMQEHDLKDWISRCHSYYKTLWFNNFKSSSIPSFAMVGRTSCRTTSSGSSNLTTLIEAEVDNQEFDTRSHRSGRTRRTSGSSKNVNRSLQRRNTEPTAMEKWFAGRQR